MTAVMFALALPAYGLTGLVVTLWRTRRRP